MPTGTIPNYLHSLRSIQSLSVTFILMLSLYFFLNIPSDFFTTGFSLKFPYGFLPPYSICISTPANRFKLAVLTIINDPSLSKSSSSWKLSMLNFESNSIVRGCKFCSCLFNFKDLIYALLKKLSLFDSRINATENALFK